MEHVESGHNNNSGSRPYCLLLINPPHTSTCFHPEKNVNLKNILYIRCKIGIIRVQVGIYHEIVYSASVFNR